MTPQEHEEHLHEQNETARLEAFSDGVFAIAVTLLILEVHVPSPESLAGHDLFRALYDIWPKIATFVTSFLTIGIMWVNHHRMFTHIRRSDNGLLIFNLLLLLLITAVPFPTALLGDYLREEYAQQAAIIYSATFVLTAIAFNLLWRYAASGNRLIDRHADRKAVAAITRQYSFGPLLYGVAVALAFVSPWASLALNFLLAAFFALPGRAPALTGDTASAGPS
jgi:uncharacterized membrane protein